MDDVPEPIAVDAPNVESTPEAPSPPPPPLLAPLPPPRPVAEPFLFHGRAAEYFRIWIVNTLLTILTGGVFAAWAKVRKRRYLRGSTELLGHRFDYRANPRRLLIGNIIVVTLFLAYSIFGAVYPAVRIGALAVGVLLLPWVVVRSLAFNAHNTAYRGMRFRFHQPLSPAVMVFLLKPALIVLTLGFYYPAWVCSRKHYTITNHRLGDAYFHFNGNSGPFYLAYLLAGALVVFAAGAGGTLMQVLAHGPPHAVPGLAQLLPFFALYGLALFVSRHYVHAKLFNHVWNHTRLDEHAFRARMDLGRWLGLQFGNLGAIIVSCGLLYPWTVIRNCRYTASCLSLVPAGSIDGIQRLGGREGSAVGDSAAEFIGLDFGL